MLPDKTKPSPDPMLTWCIIRDILWHSAENNFIKNPHELYPQHVLGDYPFKIATSYVSHGPMTWWRHQMETFSALLALSVANSLVTGEFPSKRPVTRSFDVFFDLHPNKQLSTQSRCRWFETPSCSLWRHCNELNVFCTKFHPFSRDQWVNHISVPPTGGWFLRCDVVIKPAVVSLQSSHRHPRVCQPPLSRRLLYPLHSQPHQSSQLQSTHVASQGYGELLRDGKMVHWSLWKPQSFCLIRNSLLVSMATRELLTYQEMVYWFPW